MNNVMFFDDYGHEISFVPLILLREVINQKKRSESSVIFFLPISDTPVRMNCV